MPIYSDTSPAGPFIGDGTMTGPFPFTFKLFDPTDLLVQFTATDGTVTNAVYSTDYTVSLNADQDATPGGFINLTTTPLALNVLLTLISSVPYTQQQRIQDLSGFLPGIIVNALDKLTILVYQLLNRVNRSIQIPMSDTNIIVTLPGAAARSNKVLAFDSLGNVTVTAGVAGPKGDKGDQGIPGISGSGTGDVIAANYGTDYAADYPLLRQNIGLKIGTDVQAYSAVLTAIAASGATIGAGSTVGSGVTISDGATISGTSSGTNTGDQVLPIDSTIVVTDNTGNNVTTGHHGWAPKLDDNAAHFLNGKGAWATPSASSGAVLQVVYAEYTASTALSTAIPYDNTIPQKTEGTQILSASITPGANTNKIRVRFQGMVGFDDTGAPAAGMAASAALFWDTVANALTAAGFRMPTISSTANPTVDATSLSFEFVHVPGDTAAHTYAVRVGPGLNTYAVYMNGEKNAGRKFGGVARATLILEEIAA